MIPVRVRRPAGDADLFVDVSDRTVDEVVASLGVEQPCLIDGAVIDGMSAASGAIVAGSSIGGMIEPEGEAPWELAVAAGPGSGRRFRLRPGRYSVSHAASASIPLDGEGGGGATHAEVWLDVTESAWEVRGSSVDAFGALFRIGETWLEMRPAGGHGRRSPGRVNRPPRLVPEPPDREVPVPRIADMTHRARELRWAMLVGPIVVGGLMAVLFQPFFALFALFGPAVVLAGWVEDRIKTRRAGRRQSQADRERADAYEAQCEAVRTVVEGVERGAPAFVDAVLVAAEARPELWERRNHHPDAGRVVVGYGRAPLRPVPRPGEDALVAIAESATLTGVPITVDLAPGRVVAVVDPDRSNHIAAAAVLQQAAARGPADLRIAVISDRPRSWDWVKWLPHVLADPLAGTRLLASEPAEMEAVIDHCLDAEDETLLVVDVGDPVALGLHLVMASPRIATLVTVAHAAAVPGSATEIVASGDVIRMADRHVSSCDPIRPDAEVLDMAARSLAGCIDPERRVRGSTIPATVGLTSLDPACVDPEAIAQRWMTPPPGLSLSLGEGEAGPLRIDLVRDGPHGLVAGTTGSGKSELLRALVTGLAARYSPGDLNFVLIDYKGGSAFDACGRLPHVVGLVTDLDGRLVDRARVSLEAELRRREQLLRNLAAEDIEHHRRLGGPPLARLVIVIDEFAALASELPAFMNAVIDFAQRGRSLGVHLILATQRPAGVVSESIRANTNLRISLRVQAIADARDVIDDAAPARLPRHLPGRAYVRTGPGELRTLQTASVTCSSDRSHFATAPFGFEMYPPEMPIVEGLRDLDDIVEAIGEAAASRDAPFRPWQDDLPEVPTLADLESEGIGIGIEDLPHRQTRGVHTWDPTSNLALVGTPRSGTRETLATIVACAAHADDIGFYIVAGAGAWDSAAGLANVGDVVPASDVSRLRRLIGNLSGEVEARRRSPWSHRIVVVIDGLEPVLRTLEREHAARESLVALAAAGPSVGVTMIVAANRIGAMPTAMGAAVSRRLLFQLADPFEYSAAGVKSEQQPAHILGRCVDPASGTQIQMASIGLDEFGVARTGGWAPPPVGDLPAVCKRTEVSSHAVFDRDWYLPIGIGDRALEPVGWTLGPGEHALVVGPPRSGKSSLLRALAQVAIEREVAVIGIAPQRSPLRDVPGLEVVEGLAAEHLDELGGGSLVIVDDAFRVDAVGLEGLVAARTDARIVASARPEELRNGYTHWTKLVRDHRTGLVLAPRNPADGELVGATLPRSTATGPPGRGYLVADGDVELCQAMVE